MGKNFGINFQNLSWEEREALSEQGLDLDRLQKRAQRIRGHAGPDGAEEYVPLTPEYEATRYLGPHTLRLIQKSK